MSKKASPTAVGAFVVGAIALLVAGIVVFGSGTFFTKPRHFVAVFDGSVYGLNVGAPVSFRGVRLGSVTNIVPVMVTKDDQLGSVYLEVILELQRGVFQGVSEQIQDISDADLAKVLIKRGLRAQLALQSLVTGQLYVDLDFYPDTPVNLRSVRSHYPELPTIQSGLQKIGKTIETLPIDQLASKAVSALEGIDRIVNSKAVEEILAGTRDSVNEIKDLIGGLESHLGPAVESVGGAAEATRQAMDQAKQTLALKEGVAGEVAGNFNEAAKAATVALTQAKQTLALDSGVPGRLAVSLMSAADGIAVATKQARSTLAELQDIVEVGSPLRSQLDAAMTELAGAARSIRVLASYLERHPEALITGKR